MLNTSTEQRQNVLRVYGLEHATPFASGTEAEVYVRDGETLLKLYRAATIALRIWRS